MACTSFGNFSIQLIAKLLADALPDCSQIYYWVTLACLGISLLLLFSLRNVTALNFEPDEDEAHQGHEQRGCLAGLLSPARLIYRKATLRAVCMVAAVLTFAELAASDMSAQVLYEMLGITHAGAAKQQEASFYYVCLPNPLIVLVTILVGLAARRFSPHRFVRVWIPITAVIFACPALLTIYHENWAIIIGGFCAILPLTNYAPLQALVVHVVPSSRVGEAMGSMAACKNLVSFVAPFIMGAMAETLARTDNSDKLWVIYPGCAVIMFCAWPLTWLLQSRVPRDSRATWSSWASTARPSLFMARPSTMRLSTGARPSTARLSTGTRPSTGTAPTAPPGM